MLLYLQCHGMDLKRQGGMGKETRCFSISIDLLNFSFLQTQFPISLALFAVSCAKYASQILFDPSIVIPVQMS